MSPTKRTVLDLPLRRRIVETVTAHPGIHLRKLADQLGIAVSTLEYHCYQLVKTEHLNTRESAGYKAFYPAQGVDRRDKDILYIVRQEAPRRICAHLLLHPGATPKQLKEVLGLSGATLTFHLNKLRKLGLLDEEPAGRTKRLHVRDEERVANVLVTYRQSFVDDAVDRFAQAWMDLHPPVRQATKADHAGAGGQMHQADRGPAAAGRTPSTDHPAPDDASSGDEPATRGTAATPGGKPPKTDATPEGEASALAGRGASQADVVRRV